MHWDRVESRGTDRLDFSQTGEHGCQRDVGIAPVVRDMAEILWIYSGAVHLFLARKGRLVCVSLKALGVMSSWDGGDSEMKVQGGLRPGVSLEPTKESVIRILRAQP